MEGIDLQKLDVAIKYVQRMSDGCNPVNNLKAEEDAIINNPNVIRCMFFIRDVLEKVRHNQINDEKTKKKSNKTDFPFEILKKFEYEEDKTITYFLKQIYQYAESDDFKKISPQKITKWLKKEGYLTREYSQEMKKLSNVPTEKGISLGIYTKLIISFSNHTYLGVIYDRSAQEYLVKNFKNIIS